MEATVYCELSGKLVKGWNIKRSGERRTWLAKATGRFRRGARYDRQIEVKEEKRVRWVSLDSFSGKVGDVEMTEGRSGDTIPFNWEV